MRVRPLVVSWTIAITIVASHRPAEAGAILFNDRSEFNAALNGDYQLVTTPPINSPLSDIWYSITGDRAGQWLGLFRGYHFYFGATFLSTTDVTAVGFDLVSTNTMSDISPFPHPVLNVPLYQGGPPPDVLFTFKTVGGIDVTATLTAASFFGVMLIDDVVSDLAWRTNEPFCFCISTFKIENLTVQSASVPEPASGLLFSMAAALVVLARRRFRSPTIRGTR
jgi:hypothetical protein